MYINCRYYISHLQIRLLGKFIYSVSTDCTDCKKKGNFSRGGISGWMLVSNKTNKAQRNGISICAMFPRLICRFSAIYNANVYKIADLLLICLNILL